MLIDAHCHLDFPDFDADREAVLARAKRAGVNHMVVPATTRRRWPDVLALGKRSEVSVCLGMHPCFMQAHEPGDETVLERMLSETGIVAVGECGIDARYTETWEAQWRVFDIQLRLAKRYRLPVVIHCVRAQDVVAKRLKQLDLPAGGLIHAFSGSVEQARRFIDLGFVLGLGGAVTYERAQRLRRAVTALPESTFVLETDSPDMPLSGFQGQRNEPAQLARVCDVVAELRSDTAANIATDSTATAQRLFGLSA